MVYIGLALTLIGIALQLDPYYHSGWLTLGCVFLAGGFLFLGFFGRRQASGGRSFLDKIDPETFTIILPVLVFLGGLLVFALGDAIYNIVIREMDINAAKAGLSMHYETPQTPRER